METNTPHNENPEQNQIAEFHDEIKQIEIEGHEQGIRKARNALFITAGLVLLSEIIALASSGESPNIWWFIIVGVEVGVFIALALWTKQKPHTAIVLGLVAFGLIWILGIGVTIFVGGDAVDIGKAVGGGIIVKIIILVNMIRALPSAKIVQQYRQEK